MSRTADRITRDHLRGVKGYSRVRAWLAVRRAPSAVFTEQQPAWDQAMVERVSAALHHKVMGMPHDPKHWTEAIVHQVVVDTVLLREGVIRIEDFEQ